MVGFPPKGTWHLQKAPTHPMPLKHLVQQHQQESNTLLARLLVIFRAPGAAAKLLSSKSVLLCCFKTKNPTHSKSSMSPQAAISTTFYQQLWESDRGFSVGQHQPLLILSLLSLRIKQADPPWTSKFLHFQHLCCNWGRKQPAVESQNQEPIHEKCHYSLQTNSFLCPGVQISLVGKASTRTPLEALRRFGMARCASGWISGKIHSPKEQWFSGTSCPAKWHRHHPGGAPDHGDVALRDGQWLLVGWAGLDSVILKAFPTWQILWALS